MALHIAKADGSRLSDAGSRRDGVPGRLYSSSYKFMQHLKNQTNLKAFMTSFAAQNPGCDPAVDQKLLEPNQDTPETSKFVSSAHLNIRAVGDLSHRNHSSVSQSQLYHYHYTFVSSLKTGSLEPSCEASLALNNNNNGIWIRPGEFLRGEGVDESQFSLGDISLLLRKKEQAASKFRGNKSIFGDR